MTNENRLKLWYETPNFKTLIEKKNKPNTISMRLLSVTLGTVELFNMYYNFPIELTNSYMETKILVQNIEYRNGDQAYGYV